MYRRDIRPVFPMLSGWFLKQHVITTFPNLSGSQISSLENTGISFLEQPDNGILL
jgi:hypothetical protein